MNVPGVIRESTVKLRKNKSCFGCEEHLGVGSEAIVSVNVNEGSVYSLYYHLACADMRDEIGPDDWAGGEFYRGFVKRYKEG